MNNVFLLLESVLEVWTVLTKLAVINGIWEEKQKENSSVNDKANNIQQTKEKKDNMMQG